jgi:hypothetical protein
MSNRIKDREIHAFVPQDGFDIDTVVDDLTLHL